MKTTIKSIATGKIRNYTFGENSLWSGYKKDEFFDSATVNLLGIENDEHADEIHHGGVDKAIHIGSYKHLEQNPEFDELSIGCNILVNDIDENDVCLGDVFSIGKVVVVVTQPRQPCWKIGALFGKEVSRYISKEHATGWYVRVIKEGTIKKDDEMVLKKRKSEVTIKQMSEYLKNPPEDREIIDEILSSISLADSYKKDFLEALHKNNF